MSNYNAKRSLLSKAGVAVGRNPNKDTINNLYRLHFGDVDPTVVTAEMIISRQDALKTVEPEPAAIEAWNPGPLDDSDVTAFKSGPELSGSVEPARPVVMVDLPVTLRTGLYKLGTGWSIPAIGLTHIHTHGSYVRISYHGCEMTLADTFLLIGAISYIRLDFPETPELSITDLNYPLEVIYS